MSWAAAALHQQAVEAVAVHSCRSCGSVGDAVVDAAAALNAAEASAWEAAWRAQHRCFAGMAATKGSQVDEGRLDREAASATSRGASCQTGAAAAHDGDGDRQKRRRRRPRRTATAAAPQREEQMAMR